MIIHKNAVSYSATTLASVMMNSIFQFYYVKIFLSVYKISNSWFYAAQVVYMIWNAVNDPLFGYLQDTSTWAVFRIRRKAILVMAPVFALSFLTPWFPWKFLLDTNWMVGLHLIFSLCFYDGLFTFVVLAQCCLFAEISQAQSDRQTILKYSQVASIVGAGALFVSALVYNRKNFHGFQAVCVVVAVLSWLLMRYSATHVKVAVEANMSANPQTDSDKTSDASTLSVMTLFKQIVTQRNFVCFVAMNFFQVFHTTFGSNFFLIFAERLIGPDVLPPIVQSVLAGSAFMLPQIIVLTISPLLSTVGYYRLIMMSFVVKWNKSRRSDASIRLRCSTVMGQFFFALFVFIAGKEYHWLLCLFFLLDKSLPDATFSLFNLSVSDIIDADKDKFNRKLPISSMIFATNALFTKPAQSIAPMLVLNVLSRYGYEQKSSYFHKTVPEAAAHNMEVQSIMFQVLCLVPMCIAVVQIVIWNFYTLRYSHKTQERFIALQ